MGIKDTQQPGFSLYAHRLNPHVQQQRQQQQRQQQQQQQQQRVVYAVLWQPLQRRIEIKQGKSSLAPPAGSGLRRRSPSGRRAPRGGGVASVCLPRSSRIALKSAGFTLDSSRVWGTRFTSAADALFPFSSVAHSDAPPAAPAAAGAAIDGDPGVTHRARGRAKAYSHAAAARAAAAAALLLGVALWATLFGGFRRAAATAAGKAGAAATQEAAEAAAAEAEAKAKAAAADAAAEEAEAKAKAAAAEAAAAEGAEAAAKMEGESAEKEESTQWARRPAAAAPPTEEVALQQPADEAAGVAEAAAAKVAYMESLAAIAQRLGRLLKSKEAAKILQQLDKAVAGAKQQGLAIAWQQQHQQQHLQQQEGEEEEFREKMMEAAEAHDVCWELLEDHYSRLLGTVDGLLQLTQQSLFAAAQSGAEQTGRLAKTRTLLQLLSGQAAGCFAPPRSNPLEVHLLYAELNLKAGRSEVGSLHAAIDSFRSRVYPAGEAAPPHLLLQEAVAAAGIMNVFKDRMQRLMGDSLYWRKDAAALVRFSARSQVDSCLLNVAAMQLELEISSYWSSDRPPGDGQRQEGQLMRLTASRVKEVLQQICELQQRLHASDEPSAALDGLRKAQLLVQVATQEMETVRGVFFSGAAGFEEGPLVAQQQQQHSPKEKAQVLRTQLMPVLAPVISTAEGSLLADPLDPQTRMDLEFLKGALPEDTQLLPSGQQYKQWSDSMARLMPLLQQVQQQARLVFTATEPAALQEAARAILRLAAEMKDEADAALRHSTGCKASLRTERALADAIEEHHEAKMALRNLKQQQQQRQQQEKEERTLPMRSTAKVLAEAKKVMREADPHAAAAMITAVEEERQAAETHLRERQAALRWGELTSPTTPKPHYTQNQQQHQQQQQEPRGQDD
ncbi:hypothetical protein Efla_001496 [Eimeria flavescens]